MLTEYGLKQIFDYGTIKKNIKRAGVPALSNGSLETLKH